MIARGEFCRKLRELGYTFKTEAKRVYLWRRAGGTHVVTVPKKELVPDEYVVQQLRQCGCLESEIKDFLACATPQKVEKA